MKWLSSGVLPAKIQQLQYSCVLTGKFVVNFGNPDRGVHFHSKYPSMFSNKKKSGSIFTAFTNVSSTLGNNRTHYPLTVCYCGPLMGGPQCRLSILRNGNVPCRYFSDFPVDFKIVQRRLSILRNGNVPFHYILNFPVDFKRVLCRLSNLRKTMSPCRI